MHGLSYEGKRVNAEVGRIIHMIEVKGFKGIIEVPTKDNDITIGVAEVFGTLYRNGVDASIHEVLVSDEGCILLGCIHHVNGEILLKVDPDIDTWYKYSDKIGVVIRNYCRLMGLQKSHMEKGSGLLCPWNRLRDEKDTWLTDSTLDMYNHPFKICVTADNGESLLYNMEEPFNNIDTVLYNQLLHAGAAGKKCEVKVIGYFNGKPIDCMSLIWYGDEPDLTINGLYFSELPSIILMHVRAVMREHGWRPDEMEN